MKLMVCVCMYTVINLVIPLMNSGAESREYTSNPLLLGSQNSACQTLTLKIQ